MCLSLFSSNNDRLLSHAQRSAVKVLRRMQYFVARKKFQAGRHIGEARNVSPRRDIARLESAVLQNPE
ncbi:hypothetical protein PAMP_020025 [Pampus punctatissimus]